MFEGKKLDVNDGKKLKLFVEITKDELEEYMKIKRIEYSVKRSKINELVDRLGDKYVQTKNSALHSIRKIREII